MGMGARSPTENPLVPLLSPRFAARDALSPSPQPQLNPLPTTRRKGRSVQEWLVISASGWSYQEEVGKVSIMRRTGLPARDLRVLDSAMSYPSTILGRERAIVINLEHVKAIITATEVLIPSSTDPFVSTFVQCLKSRVSTSLSHTQQDVEASKDVDGSPSFAINTGSPRQGTVDSQQESVRMQSPVSSNEVEATSPWNKMGEATYEGEKVLPFEFRALEACLESACKCLESETSELEKVAYPALDELTSRISTLNLERVRQIKSHLVAISVRVHKVRDELEHLLDHDMDMTVLHLTEKLVSQAARASSRFDLDKVSSEEVDDEEESKGESIGGFKPVVDELEMLLEAYFVQIDGTLNKLSTLREYVDDTEDYINIRLRDKQNQLLQVGVMLSFASIILTIGLAITGILAINIRIPFYESPQIVFLETTVGLAGASIFVYLLFIWWARNKGLLR